MSTPPSLLKGLTDAHRKLSDYFHTFDESPFYLWSSLLDPRISYDALRDDFQDDPQLSAELESAKSNLRRYFDENYPPLLSNGGKGEKLNFRDFIAWLVIYYPYLDQQLQSRGFFPVAVTLSRFGALVLNQRRFDA
ncbi:hypothetical protein JR316_0011884 [Psilocybe cubensis]|uniref:Uncharacterized protein n=1 Tax=Psilocybe cubensis TaxID=181762 RepID=A0ACB8GLG7_PSICU|nr:hypothetical protein JR316_0011884 [Psilocybe cubensis]KAH9476309.1 hypothetical protein JR316_0011884 [Psilocybe cubensis]